MTLADTARAVGIAAIVILLSITVGGAVFEVTNPSDGSFFVGTDNEERLENVDNVTEVKDSTGRAASLAAGQDVEISGGIGVEGSVWSWSTWTATDDTSRDQIIWSVRDNWILAYNSTTPEWILWHYNDSSTHSYRVSVPANDTATLRNVQATRNGSTVTLYNDSGTSASVTLTPGTDSSAAAPTYKSLDGGLEETRTFDTELNASQRQALRNKPLKPVAVGDRDARLMFDKKGRNVAVDLRNADGEITGSNSLLGSVRRSGLAGTVMTRGVDYEIDQRTGGSYIVLKSGGELEDMPRIAISTPDTIAEGLIGDLVSAMSLLVVGLLVFVVATLNEQLDL